MDAIKKHLPKIIIIAVVLTITLFVVIFFTVNPETLPKPGKKPTTFQQVSEASKVEKCLDETCMNEYFKTCHPASLETESPLGNVFYKITGKSANGCRVTWKYVDHRNENWVGKEITCEFDNSKTFLEAARDNFDALISDKVECTGSLYRLMQSRSSGLSTKF